jgi:hypothetical protein
MNHSKKGASNSQPFASLCADTGLSDVPGKETSPCQEEEETHLPCTVRVHTIGNTNAIERFMGRFSMTPFKHLHRKNELNA